MPVVVSKIRKVHASLVCGIPRCQPTEANGKHTELKRIKEQWQAAPASTNMSLQTNLLNSTSLMLAFQDNLCKLCFLL